MVLGIVDAKNDKLCADVAALAAQHAKLVDMLVLAMPILAQNAADAAVNYPKDKQPQMFYEDAKKLLVKIGVDPKWAM